MEEYKTATINLNNEYKTYKLNVDKINSLEDVKEVLDGLNISLTIKSGCTTSKFKLDKLLKYMD